VEIKNTKTEKKRISNFNLAKTEAWLRNQAKIGWKLTEVKSGILFHTFVFVKSTPGDYLYFAPAYFGKKQKLWNTSYGIINYIKRTYKGKDVSKKGFSGWICIKQSDATDIEDIRKHLQYRENCIRKGYLQDFALFAIPACVLAIAGLLVKEKLPFYCFSAFIGTLSTIPAIQLILHKTNSKKVYANFDKSER